jgi:HAMP domain-containing protein
MNLRQKLLTTFGGLLTLTLLTAGFTLWSIDRWRSSEAALRNHYQRSLFLQRIRGTTFRAVKEVSDALTGRDSDARQEFETALQPIDQDFQQWVALAETPEERQQVQQVRAAYAAIVRDATRVFDLLAAGQSQAALRLMEAQFEAQTLVNFQRLTEEAIASDRRNREVIQGQVQTTRQTSQVALAIAAFAAISLMLLLAAYLASDLFVPLKKLTTALNDVAHGDLNRRLSDDRSDELGEVQQAFNQMVEAMAQRRQLNTLELSPESPRPVSWQELPSRLTLHRLIAQLRSQLSTLKADEQGANTQATIAQLEQLVQAIARFTEFGFPLDLNLAATDIRALLYEILLRF